MFAIPLVDLVNRVGRTLRADIVNRAGYTLRADLSNYACVRAVVCCVTLSVVSAFVGVRLGLCCVITSFRACVHAIACAPVPCLVQCVGLMFVCADLAMQ